MSGNPLSWGLMLAIVTWFSRLLHQRRCSSLANVLCYVCVGEHRIRNAVLGCYPTVSSFPLYPGRAMCRDAMYKYVHKAGCKYEHCQQR